MKLNIPTYNDNPFASHRHGWPLVLEALRKRAVTGPNDDEGIPFDDFVEASQYYRPIPYERKRPWVGIFHHPDKVNSPLELDKSSQVRRTLETKSETWDRCPPPLGVIALSGDLAYYVGNWMRVPHCALWHPTDLNVPLWRPDQYFARPRIVQLGHYLRDTRAIMRLPPRKGVEYFRSAPSEPWQRERDALLKAEYKGREVNRLVQDLPHVAGPAYDELLSTSVGLTYLYGAGANNVVIESIARAAPLFVNRMPATEEYLGPDYPLYIRHPAEIESKLTHYHLLSAHGYLLDWRDQHRDRFNVENFADDVLEFSEKCQRRHLRKNSALKIFPFVNPFVRQYRKFQRARRKAV